MAEQLTRGVDTQLQVVESIEDETARISVQLEESDPLDVPALDPLDFNAPEMRSRRNVAEQLSRRRAVDLWSRASDGDSTAAVDLIAGSVTDEDPVVQASAAVSILTIYGQGTQEAELVARDEYAQLQDIAASRHLEARRIAEAFVLQLDDHPSDFPRRVVQRKPARIHTSSDARLSIGVHGTFSHYSRGPLTPMHGFYGFLRRDLADDLYKDTKSYFRWGGRYTRTSRAEGAQRLLEWVDAYGASLGPRVVFAHSHGGNVVLDALAQGLEVDRLILLSTPAIRRSTGEWSAIRSNVGRAAAYRTRLDQVVLADQLASRLPWGRLDREVSDGLNFPPSSGIFQPSPLGWLSHSGWLQERTWKKHGIDDSVRAEIEWGSP